MSTGQRNIFIRLFFEKKASLKSEILTPKEAKTIETAIKFYICYKFFQEILHIGEGRILRNSGRV